MFESCHRPGFSLAESDELRSCSLLRRTSEYVRDHCDQFEVTGTVHERDARENERARCASLKAKACGYDGVQQLQLEGLGAGAPCLS